MNPKTKPTPPPQKKGIVGEIIYLSLCVHTHMFMQIGAWVCACFETASCNAQFALINLTHFKGICMGPKACRGKEI